MDYLTLLFACLTLPLTVVVFAQRASATSWYQLAVQEMALRERRDRELAAVKAELVVLRQKAKAAAVARANYWRRKRQQPQQATAVI